MSQARRALIALISVVAVFLGFAPNAFAQSTPAATHPAAAPRAAARVVAASTATGYWLSDNGGNIFSGGSAVAHGGTGATILNHPIVGIASTPSRKGYWLVASDGGIFSFGDAAFHGSTGAITLNKPIVDMASTPSGKGYWLVASDGGIFSFGDAAFHGSTGAMALNKPIVGMTSTPSGKGYWLVASDGGVFSFGDAAFHGSTGAITLNKPIVGMASTPTGHGYWFVAADGGIFSFGDAAFHGSTGAITLNQPIVGMAATPTGKGYWFVAADGGVFSFGDAVFHGSGTEGAHLSVIGMASSSPALPPATHLVVTTDPSASTGGVPFATQPVVHLLDSKGATATSATNPVTLSIAGSPAGVVLTCDNNTVNAVGGVATFQGCSINKAGTYTLHATSGALVPDTAPATITVGPASQVAFSTEPSATAVSGTAFGVQPTGTVEDAGGNTVTAATTITLSVGAGTTLVCNQAGNALLATNGVSAFTGCKLTGTAGPYTLHATNGTVTGTSSSIAVGASAATHLVFTVQPSSTALSGSAIAQQPTVTVEDVSGNTVTTANNITLSPSGAALACTGSDTKATTSGVAAFTGCTLTGTPGSYTLGATNGTVTGTSTAVVLAVGTATHLVFTVEPSATEASGVALGVSPTVTVEDSAGNTVTTANNITLTSSPAGAALTCTQAANTQATTVGVATFTGCTLTGTIGNYTLSASNGTVNGTSTAIALGAGAASQVLFTSQPSGIETSGTVLGQQPTVTVKDASGNTVTTANTITLTSAPAGATLVCDQAGNALVATNGVATFTGCKLTGTAATYHLHATNGTFTADSTNIVVGVGAATQVIFTTQPSTTEASGTALATSPTVTVEDASGNTVTTANTITLTEAPAGAVLVCDQAGNAMAATNGVAVFTGCKLTGTASTYHLHATNGTVAADSTNIALGSGPATQVLFTIQPSTTEASGAALGTSPTVTVEDASGNIVGTANTITLTEAPAGAVLTCDQAGNVLIATNGVAAFTGCKLTGTAATYHLHATNGTLTADSTNIALGAGAASQAVFTTQPSATEASGTALGTSPTVTVEDASGNIVTTANTITLTEAPAGAVLVCDQAGNALAATNGVATFTGCKLTGTAATYHLHASNGTVTGDSTNIALGAGAASQTVFTSQPSTTAANGTAFGAQPTVTVEDASGNTVTTANTITLTEAPAGATLVCDQAGNALAATNGVAAFTGCKLTGTAATYHLHASNGTVTGDSTNIALGAGAATQLVYTVVPVDNQPSTTNFTTMPTVTVEDASGNTVTTANTITLTLSAGGVLACTQAANTLIATNGVAAFTGCNITGPAAPYTLTAGNGTLTVGATVTVV